MVNGVLFDLDGTLVDSAIETAQILNAMRAERGKIPLGADAYRHLISYGARALVQCACESESSVDQLVNEFRARYREVTTTSSSLYPAVKETLVALREQGKHLGVCTNKPDYLCHQVLADTGLVPFFDVVIAGGATAHLKPHREPIDQAVLGLSCGYEEVVLVGDSSVDQQAAAAAGIPFVFFSSGYDDGVDQAAALAVIERMEQLPDCLSECRDE